MQKILIIQTAFIGDVVLATGLLEKLHQYFPDAQLDILVRKGNETLFTNHPFINETLVWDKRQNKSANLWKTLGKIRRRNYDLLINVQRFAATGFLTAFSGAKETIGFDKNPFSFLFTRKIKHIIGEGAAGMHEIDRNQALIRDITDEKPAKPRLYPATKDEQKVAAFKNNPYITISPASVWFTKQYPAEKWAAFLSTVPKSYSLFFLGALSDKSLCEQIQRTLVGFNMINLAGTLSFLQSASLMRDAQMNFVNDSAPLHFASAMNAPVTAVYCSTIPAFGFGPLSDQHFIVEIKKPLDCRPCGLHGYNACPKGHFKCAYEIEDMQLTEVLKLNS